MYKQIKEFSSLTESFGLNVRSHYLKKLRLSKFTHFSSISAESDKSSLLLSFPSTVDTSFVKNDKISIADELKQIHLSKK